MTDSPPKELSDALRSVWENPPLELAEAPAGARTPESLTGLERRWLKVRGCGWCDAPGHRNTCHAMYGAKCTAKQLNERRARWLRDYKPRKP